MNDIWRTTNGIDFELIKPDTNNLSNPRIFNARFGHTTTVFNNNLYLIGGRDE